MSSTEAYYNRHAQQFVDDTLHVDMRSLYVPFLAGLPVNARILDAGCGSGRDARAFQKQGYQVSAFDASEPLASRASQLLGFTVPVKRFDEVEEIERYDGIWACASLLHVPENQLRACGGRSSLADCCIAASNGGRANANTMAATSPMRMKHALACGPGRFPA